MQIKSTIAEEQQDKGEDRETRRKNLSHVGRKY